MEVWPTVSEEHALQIHVRFIQTNEEFYLFNIYAPCDLLAKHKLWVSLSVQLQMLRGKKVLCGDFNAVRCAEERSLRGSVATHDIHHFSQFIDDNGLVDMLLNGRYFTWYKGDGTSMSRIDRFLLHYLKT